MPEKEIATVPFANSVGREREAFLHVRRENNETQVWITGLALDDYEGIVGPERAAEHRLALRRVSSEYPVGSVGVVGYLKRKLGRK